MGLDTTHGCWNGSYTGFHKWREFIAEVSGLGDLNEYKGFGPEDDRKFMVTEGTRPWLEGDPLTSLLCHSDCDGCIRWEECNSLADCLEELLPAARRRDSRDGPLSRFEKYTQQFIAGLRLAAEKKENVEFR